MATTTELLKNSSIGVLAVLLLGSIAYNVMDTGNELTCRTNSPTGWVVLEAYDGVFKAECPYKTKPAVEAYCSSFRSTASYERYGCAEVILLEVQPDDGGELRDTDSLAAEIEVCDFDGCTKIK